MESRRPGFKAGKIRLERFKRGRIINRPESRIWRKRKSFAVFVMDLSHKIALKWEIC